MRTYNPPELHPWDGKSMADGAKSLKCKRRERHGRSGKKRTNGTLFFMIYVAKWADHPNYENVGDFRLMDQKSYVIKHTAQNERVLWKALLGVAGFNRTILVFIRPRCSTGSNTNWKLAENSYIALEGITSFTHPSLCVGQQWPVVMTS